MIRHIRTYKIPLLLTVFLFLIHLANKDFKNPYERPIAGDAQAYYAYLPALFIYQDLGYEFIAPINKKYYPVSHQKSFLKPAGTGKVNKTFPGAALLYLPFFLLAHALALFFGLEADGYSTIYQVCFDLGLWVYLYFGLVFLIKVLKKINISNNIATLSAVIILLSTNMVFYTIFDQSVTHIYNFFMINGFLLCMLSLKQKLQLNTVAMSLFIIALIGITRPTNILVLFLLFFFIPQIDYYKKLLQYIFNWRRLPVLILPLLVLFIPFLFWKAQTGNWIVYSYGDEGFNFSNPHISVFLFSYLKGWLTYSPLLIFILIAGLFLLYKKSRKQAVIALLFYTVSIYVFSSWWCWYYGAGMGQRVMIDHYILMAYLLAILLQKISISKYQSLRVGFAILAVGCIGLNTVQAYQIRYGILTGGSATKQQYWDNFLTLEKKARVYPHDHWALEETHIISFAKNSAHILKGNSYAIENEWCIEVSAYENYSAQIELPNRNLRKGSKLIIGFEARARQTITETRAVLYLDNLPIVFGLDTYLKKDQWVKIEFMVEPSLLINEPATLYFWNGKTNEKVEIKALKVDHYFSEEYL